MATVTGYTAAYTEERLGEMIIDGEVSGDDLLLTKGNGDTFIAGNVRGPAGTDAATGDVAATAGTTPIRASGGRVKGGTATEVDDLTTKAQMDAADTATGAAAVATAEAYTDGLVKATEIGNTVDLNTKTTPGTFIQSDVAETDISTWHYPVVAAGMLRVDKNVAGDKVFQTYSPFVSPSTFYKRTYNGTSWTAWSLFQERTDSGWINLSLQNGWVDYSSVHGGGYTTPQYRKINGLVYIKGLIGNGTTTAGTLIATLPSGYRPTERIIQLGLGNTVIARIDIGTDGTIITEAGVSASFTSLNFPPFIAA